MLKNIGDTHKRRYIYIYIYATYYQHKTAKCFILCNMRWSCVIATEINRLRWVFAAVWQNILVFFSIFSRFLYILFLLFMLWHHQHIWIIKYFYVLVVGIGYIIYIVGYTVCVCAFFFPPLSFVIFWVCHKGFGFLYKCLHILDRDWHKFIFLGVLHIRYRY